MDRVGEPDGRSDQKAAVTGGEYEWGPKACDIRRDVVESHGTRGHGRKYTCGFRVLCGTQ